jgi:SpoVK/Ycf46/Vps4 family AAA+-type ATPase
MHSVPTDAVSPGRFFVTSAYDAAPSLDLLCVRFALRAVLDLGPKFNLRRDINNVITLSGRYLVWPEAVLTKLHSFISRRCLEMSAWEGVAQLSLEDFMSKHGSWNGLYDDSQFYYYLDEFVKLNGKDLLAVFQTTAEHLNTRLAKQHVRLVDNVTMLAKVLGLSEGEQTLLTHAALCKYQRDLRPVLVDCKAASAQEAYAMLGHVLHLSAQSIAEALKPGARLEILGLTDSPIAEHAITDLGDLLRVSDKLLQILNADYASEAALMAAFTRPASAATLALADYPHVEQDLRYLIALLKAACKTGERGVNVLIYGPPGTGKTELAKLVAKEAGSELYEVDCLDRDGNSLSGRERYRSLQVSQAFLRGRHQAAILFDEVEDVFPPVSEAVMNMFGGEETKGAAVQGKAWINQTLETNPVPTLWISNAIAQIDPAYKRRFQFHLELANPPQGVRESIARKHLEVLGVSTEFLAKIAARKSLTPAQIQSAARFATLTRTSIDEPVEDLLLKQIDRADKALGNEGEGAEYRPMVTNYDLGMLNIETRYPVEKILTSLKARPRASICFYGPPGTGKTALAEHIAKTLERPLMIKKASDLMSKYVGETEQQMAQMFRSAQADKAVLLLDEADSFLQNRQLAQRSYEVTEVNEMLQGMERFDGVFICTTNLFDRIDEAALRRFSFKIRFRPLTAQQRESMFVREALGGDAALLSPAVLARLAKLELLAPGDFAAVCRQNQLLGEEFSAEDFIDQLEKEHAVKPDVRFSRPMGFTH